MTRTYIGCRRAPPAALFAPQKKRVIVDPADYSAVMTSVQAVFGTQQNIILGPKIADSGTDGIQ
jgi:hypothetical protein